MIPNSAAPPLIIGNHRELLTAFSDLGTVVGPRIGPAHRSKDQKEWYCLRRLLLTLGAENLLSYPLQIAKAESPDFIVNDRPRGRYGIEVTEATDQDWQQELTATEPAAALNWISCDVGHLGDEPELTWCRSVVRRIEAKVKSISQPKYQASRSDVLIYENGRPGTERTKAVQLLRTNFPVLAAKCRCSDRLGKITVLSGPLVLHDVFGEFRTMMRPHAVRTLIEDLLAMP